jgi:hypothetical protein
MRKVYEPFASWINGTQKYVASTTLETVDQWPNSTLIATYRPAR